GRFIDAAPHFKEKFSTDLAKPGHFAGYDPLSDSFVIVTDPVAADFLSNPGMACPPQGSFWVESSPSSGNWGLSCFYQQVSTIKRTGGGQEDLLFQLQPSFPDPSSSSIAAVGTTPFELAATYTIDLISAGKPVRRISSGARLPYDQPIPLGPPPASADGASEAPYLKLTASP
ncbi:MAG: hypothetical protein JWO82_1848, partial [Akkermansiaceae bacterium]|nr:hypothetical protein [Akkermansiaceae bacterium]